LKKRLIKLFMSQTVPLPTLADTQNLGAWLAGQLKAGDVLLLHGDLGAGKTTLARAIIQTLCPHETEVPSPTFTLVQHYESALGPLAHFDLYRVKYSEEIIELGWHDALQGIVLVEWPDRLGPLLPPKARHVRLQHGENHSAILENF
jgi:tRNA threonylcarbamoyladenosine biosynthesis protein TsaE